MRGKRKKIIAFFLAFVLCVSTVDTSVFAAGMQAGVQGEADTKEAVLDETTDASSVETQTEASEGLADEEQASSEATSASVESTTASTTEESATQASQSEAASESIEETTAAASTKASGETTTQEPTAASKDATTDTKSFAAMTEEEKLAALKALQEEQEAAIGEVSDEVKNDMGEEIDTVQSASSIAVPDSFKLTSEQDYDIAPGITETNATVRKKSSDGQSKVYIANVDLSNSTVGVLAGYKDYDSSGKFGMQTVRDQAAACEKKTGKKIVFAMQGDYYNMTSGKPTGVLIMNGITVSPAIKDGIISEEAYFAILKDGTAVIRDGGTDTSDVQQAIGSPIRLIKNGVVMTWFNSDETINPRGAVGVKKDGSVVFVDIDGRQAPRSVGFSMQDVAELMASLGCVDATYLDGGGSATFVTKRAGESALSVKNSPSDGVERSVASTILVYSDAKSDGTFVSAKLTPQGEIYTPNTKVTFEATGVDSSGTKVDLPSDAKFQLADSKYGTIDEKTGVFSSNGTTGEVTVQLVSGGQVVGKTTIEIAEPDKLSFNNDEVSLDFAQESTLGLMVEYNTLDINYKDGDFEWTISDVTDANKNPTDKTLGTFDGNTFTSSDGDTLYGTVTCTYTKKDGTKLSASVKVIVGLAPTVVMDFEDVTNEDGTVTKAEDYWTFNRTVFNANGGLLHIWDTKGNSLGMTPTANLLYGHYTNDASDPTNESKWRGGNESAEIVDIASGEPVLKGNHSLKINYDFTKDNGIEGACVGFSEATQAIEGTPTKIGMYVYAPEKTPNLWVRIRLRDGNGSIVTLNFNEQYVVDSEGNKVTITNEDGTTRTLLGGIDWVGWKYLEADLSNVVAPYSLIGGETIRFMCMTVNGSDAIGHYYNDYADERKTVCPQDQCKGSVYVDNLQFVYGTNTTDTDNPVISDIKVGNTSLSDNNDTKLTSNTASFTVNVSDVENKYTTGVDYDTVNVTLDGKNITNEQKEKGNLVSDSSKDEVYLYNQYLSNGEHTVKFTIRDKEGNETSTSRTFTVEGTSQKTPAIQVVPQTKTANIGGDVSLDIVSDQLENTGDVTSTIRFATGFTDYSVTYGANYEEASAPTWNENTNSVSISAKKKDGASKTGSGVIATVSVKVPADTDSQSKFTYTVTAGNASVTSTDASTSEIGFTTSEKELAISAKYTVEISKFLAGQDAFITVKDQDGNVAANVDVYKTDGTKLGTTNEKGTLTTNVFKEVESISIYAKDSEGYLSFVKTTQSYTAGANEDGTPTFISLNASDDSETSKNVTWLSNPSKAAKKSVVQVATKADYNKKKESAFQTYEGDIKLRDFNGLGVADNRLTYANTVLVTGLTPDTEYVYRVGDGTIYSDVMSFKTGYAGSDTSFFLIGDTQANDKTVISNIVKTLSEGSYNFGVQTGDFVEKANVYSEWSSILTAFDNKAFKNMDMIHVTGNHELYGDTTGEVSKDLFNIKNQKHYSVTYNNVYVAVLGFDESQNGVQETAEWLAKNAAASDARWKIVVSHQPPYGTNAQTSDCRYFTQYITKAAQEGGIDFMFSGHDHAYARTYPLIDGKKVVDKDSDTYSGDGIVYFVLGSTGEKSYSVTKDDAIHADAGNDFYEGLYFTVNATNNTFAISVHNEKGEVVKSYTKTKETCKNDIHTYYLKDAKHLVCKVCGYATNDIADYTGLVYASKDGLPMYLENGTAIKNTWKIVNDDYYYFGTDGVALTGTQKINGIEYTFDKDGKYVKGSFVQEQVTDGTTTKTITRYYEGGGVYATHWREIDGNMYYFKKTGNSTKVYDLGMMYTGDGVKEQLVKTVANNQNRYFVFAKDGKLVRGAFDTMDVNGETKVRYYWGDEYVTGKKVIEGHTYQFDKDGYMEMTSISDCTVASIANQTYTGSKIKPELTVKDGKQSLTAGTYYKASYENNINAGTATVTLTGIEKRGYTGTKTVTFKITRKKISDSSIKVSIPTCVYNTKELTPAVKVKDGKKTLTPVTDYTVTYKNNVNMGQASVVIKGNGNYKSTVTKTFNIVPKKVTGLEVTAKPYNSVSLKWKRLKGVTGYRIYRSTDGANYARIKTIKGDATVTYKDTDVKCGTKYYYEVRAYKTSNSTTYYGEYSSIVGATPKLGKATIASAKNASAKKATLTWSKVSGASGYMVYMSTSKAGTYTRVKGINGVSIVTYTKAKLTKGKKYYFKVRAFRTVDGKKVYGAYSAIKSVTIKK